MYFLQDVILLDILVVLWHMIEIVFPMLGILLALELPSPALMDTSLLVLDSGPVCLLGGGLMKKLNAEVINEKIFLISISKVVCVNSNNFLVKAPYH